MLMDYARHYVGGSDNGQNMVETALIIGVISIVIVGLFLTAGLQTGITNLSAQVACEIQGGDWSTTTDTCAGA
jgi:Flp pilus assembly pilin Flp